MLPDEGDLWAWCLEAEARRIARPSRLLRRRRRSTPCGSRATAPDDERLRHADLLAAALGLDMKAWFTPDAANYFSRVSKPQILDAIREAKQQPPAPAWEKLKKAELAQEAERQLSGSGWMPELLRPAA